jgi:hypothetical protein
LKKIIYIGWVGDSMVTIAGKNTEEKFANEPCHKPTH